MHHSFLNFGGMKPYQRALIVACVALGLGGCSELTSPAVTQTSNQEQAVFDASGRIMMDLPTLRRPQRSLAALYRQSNYAIAF
jgi:hypothetical protein